MTSPTRYGPNFNYSPDEPYYPWGPVEPDEDGDYVLWSDYDRLKASEQRLREALSAVLCMLPSDVPERPANERIPASYCYVRWQDIRDGRAALKGVA